MAKSAFNPVKKKGITRRSFLATGAAATAALGLSGKQAFADQNTIDLTGDTAKDPFADCGL